VRLTFTDLGEQTRVRLEHSGWEIFDDPAAARAEYDEGWPHVLDCYGDQSVADGLLAVTVRPWHVVLRAWGS
jgi:uncharacterized protein YndB with AHSA1/START domain